MHNSLCAGSEWCCAMISSNLNQASLSVYVASPRGFLVLLQMSQTHYKQQRRDPTAWKRYWLFTMHLSLPSLAAFSLPARLVLPVIELFSEHLSAVHRLLLRAHFLSSCAWVYVRFFFFSFLASVSSCQYSFSNTSHLSETGFHMIICKAVFGSVIQEVLMYGKRRAEQIWCEDETSTEAQTTHAVTENFNNGHKYRDGGNPFLCIVKRGDVSEQPALHCLHFDLREDAALHNRKNQLWHSNTYSHRS